MIRHGKTKTSIHNTWRQILGRCQNLNNPGYSEYGGRGISVCEEWKVFLQFEKDMGERPSKNHTIDRINTHGNYEPDNCRWATKLQQTLNHRILKNNKSGFNGVSFYRPSNKWSAALKYKRKTYYIGRYESPEIAAIERDKYIIKNNLPHKLSTEFATQDKS